MSCGSGVWSMWVCMFLVVDCYGWGLLGVELCVVGIVGVCG